MSYWRDKSREVIRQVITDNPQAEGAELKKLISNAYPFGERQYHPYEIWLDEVKKQTKPSGTKTYLYKTGGRKHEPPPDEQMKLL